MQGEERQFSAIRAIKTALLFISLIFSQYHSIMASIYATYPSFPIELNNTVIVFSLLIYCLMILSLLLILVKAVYHISRSIYVWQIIRRMRSENMAVTAMINYPVPYSDFKYKLIPYMIVANILMGLIRLIYFRYPFASGFTEAFAPVVINSIAVIIFFFSLRKKYIEPKVSGSAFISLAIPYLMFVVIFI